MGPLLDIHHTFVDYSNNLKLHSKFLFNYFSSIKGVVILSFMNMDHLKSGRYVYPYWTKIFGNILTSTTLSGVFIWAVYMVIDALFVNKRVCLKLKS